MHKELVTMPLEGFGVKIMTDRLCMTLVVDRVRNERTKNLQPRLLTMSGTAWHSLTRSGGAGWGWGRTRLAPGFCL